MIDLIKPPRLNEGDKVAAITLSWGGPGQIPHRYEIGKIQLEQEFGLKVVEAKHALKDPEWIYSNPRARADDLMECFADRTIKAIFSTIGGDDSVRILPYLDLDVIKNNPKIFMGYSDTTITHIACLLAGVRSFYGPSFMAGFAENCGMFPYMIDSMRRTLFSGETIGRIDPSRNGWTVEHLEWSQKENQSRRRKLNPAMPWEFIQGTKSADGHLIGGCADVLEMIKGTKFWPEPNYWKGAILFLENSEDSISASQFKYWLRNYGSIGILDDISGIIFSRPGGTVPPEKFKDYDDVLLQIVANEFGRPDIPIVTRMDFGHTDPMFVIPYGAAARINPIGKTFEILDSGVT